jgi:hypothetical protein
MAKTRVDYHAPGRAFKLAMKYETARHHGQTKTAAKYRRELAKLLAAVNASNEFGHEGSARAFKSKVRDAAKRGMKDMRGYHKARKRRGSFRGRSRDYIMLGKRRT